MPIIIIALGVVVGIIIYKLLGVGLGLSILGVAAARQKIEDKAMQKQLKELPESNDEKIAKNIEYLHNKEVARENEVKFKKTSNKIIITILGILFGIFFAFIAFCVVYLLVQYVQNPEAFRFYEQ